jgi:hypothetical protein
MGRMSTRIPRERPEVGIVGNARRGRPVAAYFLNGLGGPSPLLNRTRRPLVPDVLFDKSGAAVLSTDKWATEIGIPGRAVLPAVESDLDF